MRPCVSDTEQRHHRTSSGLAVFGDPVAGRALALLLQGVGHEAKFVPATLLSGNNSLNEVDLVLLTPTPELSSDRREALLNTLREVSSTDGVPILKLTGGSDKQQGVGGTGDEYLLPWPCSREELLKNVEVILACTNDHRKR